MPGGRPVRVAWIDPVGGLAGDMLVAAFIDAGASEAGLMAALQALALPGWSARCERVWRGPFHAARFVVDLEPGPRHDHQHQHDHDHDHDGAHPHAAGRSWAGIRALLETSALSPRARGHALAVFGALAVAEGRVHGQHADAVTFHEVGALDSILDIVAVGVTLDLLDVDELVVGPIPLGQGRTLGAHGWIPLPAPATLELLRGFTVEGRELRGETVTPTGAAVVAALGRTGTMPRMRIVATGVGAGSSDPVSHPNVVRVVLGETEGDGVAEVAELRAEVDSLHPELVPPLLEALLAAGALDAYVTPIVMKKGRPAVLVTCLARVALRSVVGEVLLRHGATLGYRWSVAARDELARRVISVDTRFGVVPMKVGERDGAVVHAAPEYEVCAALARTAGVPVAQVSAAAWAAWGLRG
ncbi:MAG: LarC family nickel insertion protein [Myxococcales bacterium]|nr:LarC family nickel insertion protein [Myxococcales bacterium]